MLKKIYSIIQKIPENVVPNDTFDEFIFFVRRESALTLIFWLLIFLGVLIHFLLS
jgi:hypothetical protein